MCEKRGWKIHLSTGSEFPSFGDLEICAELLAKEIEQVKPDALVFFSMGTLTGRRACHLLPGQIPPVPTVLVEGPNYGVPWWKLIIAGFSLLRPCCRDMMPSSPFMKSINGVSFNDRPVLEIQGKFSTVALAKTVFRKMPETELVSFPDLGHIKLISDERVIETILNFFDGQLGG